MRRRKRKVISATDAKRAIARTGVLIEKFIVPALKSKQFDVRTAGLSFVEQLFTGPLIKSMFRIANGRDPDVRGQVAAVFETLLSTTAHIEKNLVELLLKEKDSITIIDLMEALEGTKSVRLTGKLLQLLQHRDPLVRGAAALVLASTKCAQFTPAIRKAVSRERDPHALVRFHTAMYVAQGKRHLKKIFPFLLNDNYQVRCASANLLSFYAERNDFPVMLKHLRKAIRDEETVAARSSMKGAIKTLGRK